MILRFPRTPPPSYTHMALACHYSNSRPPSNRRIARTFTVGMPTRYTETQLWEQKLAATSESFSTQKLGNPPIGKCPVCIPKVSLIPRIGVADAPHLVFGGPWLLVPTRQRVQEEYEEG